MAEQTKPSNGKAKRKFPDPILLGGLILSATFAIYMTSHGFEIKNQTDEELYQLLTTNKTHIDKLTCADLKIGIERGQSLVLLKMEKTLPVLKKIANEKHCDFMKEISP